jgi:hypothetical protein
VQNGTLPAEKPMAQYKCIHETLLRRAQFRPQVLYTGSRPQTSPYSPSLINVQWFLPVSLWKADCTFQACVSSDAHDNCGDTISQGLFYASSWETVPDYRVVMAQVASNTKATGPRSPPPRLPKFSAGLSQVFWGSLKAG